MTKKTKKEAEIRSTRLEKIKWLCPKRGWIEEEIEVKCYGFEDKEESKHSYSFIEEDKKDD